MADAMAQHDFNARASPRGAGQVTLRDDLGIPVGERYLKLSDPARGLKAYQKSSPTHRRAAGSLLVQRSSGMGGPEQGSKAPNAR